MWKGQTFTTPVDLFIISWRLERVGGLTSVCVQLWAKVHVISTVSITTKITRTRIEDNIIIIGHLCNTMLEEFEVLYAVKSVMFQRSWLLVAALLSPVVYLYCSLLCPFESFLMILEVLQQTLGSIKKLLAVSLLPFDSWSEHPEYSHPDAPVTGLRIHSQSHVSM